jgi:hypothetical protein
VATRGRTTFDYSNDNGITRIGDADTLFETKWSRASGNSIYALNDPPSIDRVALATGGWSRRPRSGDAPTRGRAEIGDMIA